MEQDMGNGGDAVWDEWDRLTRFLESTLVAYEREYQSLNSLRGNGLKVRGASNAYAVALDDHLSAVKDTEILRESVLIHTFALAESAASNRLKVALRDLQGIEEWGTSLLELAGSSWNKVDGGLAGAVEIAVARNAFAHGTPALDARAVRRLERAGTTAFSAGQQIKLHYSDLQRYRKRLRSLLNAGGIRRSGQPSANGAKASA